MTNKLKSIFAAASATLITALSALTLASCADSSVFDDDNKIINSSSIVKTMYSDTRQNTSITVKAKSVTGVETLFTVKVNNGITVSYDAELTSGRVKIVVCNNEKVTTVFECDEDNTAANATDEQIELESGTYRIRLVGDKANFEIKSFSYAAY